MESVEGRLAEVEEMLKEFMAGMLILEKNQKEMGKNISELYESTKELRKATEEQGERIGELYESTKELRKATEEQGKNIAELYESTKELRKATEEQGKNIAELYESTKELRKATEEQGERIGELYESTKELRKATEEQGERIGELYESTKELRKATEEQGERIERLEMIQEKEIKRFNKEWGALSNKLGTIVEDIIFPATRPVLQKYFKCKITDLSLNREKLKDDLQDEFDVIAVSDECKIVFLIEVKSTPKIDYINEFKNNKIERFRKLFDEYKDYKLIPIFASLRLQSNIINYLTKQKIYAMAYREWEYMDILNFNKLQKTV